MKRRPVGQASEWTGDAPSQPRADEASSTLSQSVGQILLTVYSDLIDMCGSKRQQGHDTEADHE